MKIIALRIKWTFFALFLFVVLPSQAAIYAWTNIAGGSWTGSVNWSPNGVPGATDAAVITTAGNYTVTLNGNATVAELDLGATDGSTIQTFTIPNQTTLTVNGPIVGTAQGQFVNGISAVLAGTNMLTGTLTWSQGAFSNAMTIAANGALNIVPPDGVGFYNFTLTNNGTVNWTNAGLFGEGVSQVYNYGSWFMQGVNSYDSGGSLAFYNFGAFDAAGTNQFYLGLNFTNTGTVTVASGTLTVYEAFTSTGGALSGSGSLLLGGTSTLNGSMPIGNLQIVGGTLNGTNVLAGTLTWRGGSWSGTTTLSNNSVLNVPNESGSLTGLTLTNYGTVNWTNTSFYSGLGAQIYNYGLWDAQSDNRLYGNENGGTTTFNNFGTFRKSFSTGGSTTLDNGVVFNNTGTVDVESGTLILNTGTTSGSGAFNVAGAATLQFSGSATFANGIIFTGSGGMVLAFGGSVNGMIAVPHLQFTGGTLSGTNVLAGTMTWSAGNWSGSTTIATNSILNIVAGSGPTFDSLALTNYGTVTWTNTTIYTMNSNAQIYNYGLWVAQSDNRFYGNENTGTSIFENFGTFRKSATTGGGTLLDGNVLFTNTGTMESDAGTLTTDNFTSLGGSFVGAGSILLPGISVLNGSITTANLQVTGGSLTGTNVLAGTLTWTGGSWSGNTTLASNSVLNVPSMSGGTVGFNALTLTNYGTVNWTNTSFYSSLGTQIYNFGLWDAQSDNRFYGGENGGTTTFDNFGTFRKSATAGGTTLVDGNVTFINSGTIAALLGSITFSGPFTENSAGDLSIFLGGSTPGSGYGQIIFTRALSLLGTFTVLTENGFVPVAAETFSVLSWPSYSGAFNCMSLDLGGGFLLQPQFSATALTLTAAAYTITGGPPPLFISLSGANAHLQWPLGFPNWVLQTTSSLSTPVWLAAPGACGNLAVVPVAGSQQYFRLFNGN